MRPAEIAHRVGEKWSVRMLQVQHALRHARRDASSDDPDRFDFCRAMTPRLPKLPWAFSPTTEEADALLAGEVSALGHRWTWKPDDPAWHRAPDTGALWPSTFFGAIPYRADNPYGDVRIVWEPSRLQHLIALALLARFDRSAVGVRAVALLEAQFLSWIEANPFLIGVHYVSVMECALRLLAACHALDLTRDTLQRPETVWPGLLRLVEGHAQLIERRLSLHSSSGNHTIAEAAGLVYAGTLFPEMKHAAWWSHLGLLMLEQQAPRQILEDGGGVEQSFCYLAFIVDLYGLVVSLLQYRGRAVSTVLRSAWTRGKDVLSVLAEEPNHLPSIGDADQGHALSPFLRLSRQAKGPPASALTTFSTTGFSVLRCGYPEVGSLIFDHGPLGMPPSYGHGHADALAVVLRWDGREILIDPGTCTYTGAWEWRSYFRGTRAHNTVTVDGLDQARQEAPFMWSQPFNAGLIRSERTSKGDVRLLARHDGYRRIGVEHWRAVVVLGPAAWLIWDWMRGTGSHQLDLYWHLGVEPIREGKHFLFSGMGPSSWITVEGGDTTLHRGEESPICGWRSRTLRTRFEGRLPHEFVTRIQIGRPVFDPEIEPNVLWTLREWVRVGPIDRSVTKSDPAVQPGKFNAITTGS